MDSFFAAEVLAERGAKSVTSFDRVANEDCAESVVGDSLDQAALEAAMFRKMLSIVANLHDAGC